MPIDRNAQLNLLHKLAETFPAEMDVQVHDRFGIDRAALDFQLAYLHEHGLIECFWSTGLSGRKALRAKITCKGLDFIADDGGLTAILGVVTIRLHDDTIKELVSQRILDSDLSQPDKQRYLDKLRELPAESTKHLVLKLVDLGLESGPQALTWLQRLMHSL